MVTKTGILLINERPHDMDYQQYRRLRSKNGNRLKDYIQDGTMFYLSWQTNEIRIKGKKVRNLQRVKPYIAPK
jgi:hypothetical protein